MERRNFIKATATGLAGLLGVTAAGILWNNSGKQKDKDMDCTDILRGDGVVISPPSSNEQHSREGKPIFCHIPKEYDNNYENGYRGYGEKILAKKDLVLPTGEQLASLASDIYTSKRSLGNEPRERLFRIFRMAMNDKFWAGIFIYNRNIWTPESFGKRHGVYVVHDPQALGMSAPIDIDGLEKALQGGTEFKGVRFSNDGRIKFVPRETYTLFPLEKYYKALTSEQFNNDGLAIAHLGRRGTEGLKEIAKYQPCKIWGVETTDKPIQTVTSFHISDRGDDYWDYEDSKKGRQIDLYCNSQDKVIKEGNITCHHYWKSHALGILRQGAEINGKYLDHWIPQYDCI